MTLDHGLKIRQLLAQRKQQQQQQQQWQQPRIVPAPGGGKLHQVAPAPLPMPEPPMKSVLRPAKPGPIQGPFNPAPQQKQRHQQRQQQ